MKLLLIIAAIFALTYANPVDSDAAQFECIANYLRDKKLLDKNFKYYVKGDKIDCNSFIAETREKLMNDIFTDAEGSSSEEVDEETKAFQVLIRQNRDCMTEQYSALEYPELLMKVYIYSKAKKLSKNQKKKLLALAETEVTKKMTIATGICFAEFTFGEMFDGVMEEEDDEEKQTLEDKQTDYCIRKYVVDNELIDTKKFTVNLNPDNIDLDFECTDFIEDIFEISEETLKANFETGPDQSRRQRRCLSKAIRNENAHGYLSKVSVLSEVLTAEQRPEFRVEFIEKMKKLYIEMAKCLH